MEQSIERESQKAIELSVPISNFSESRLSLRITPLSTKHAPLLLFLSTSSTNQTGLGSFVYGIPPRPPLKEPLSTTLYSSEDGIEFATRLAKVLVRRLKCPVYVGVGEGFGGPGAFAEGLDHEVKMLKDIVSVVLDQIGEDA